MYHKSIFYLCLRIDFTARRLVLSEMVTIVINQNLMTYISIGLARQCIVFPFSHHHPPSSKRIFFLLSNELTDSTKNAWVGSNGMHFIGNVHNSIVSPEWHNDVVQIIIGGGHIFLVS